MSIEKTLNEISLNKLKSVLVYGENTGYNNFRMAMSLNHEMMRLGYVMSKDLYDAMCSAPEHEIYAYAANNIATLKEMKGDHVEHKPMYPNFPSQVMSMSDFEFFLNQVTHYWTNGEWMPSYETMARPYDIEVVDYQELGVATEKEVLGVFTNLLRSNDSIKESDKEMIKFFMTYLDSDLVYPDTIPFKENVCIVAGMFIEQGKSIHKLVKSATDILRIATFLSDGDVSLAANTKFKSFSRPVRRTLTKTLENVITEEDINRHRNKWVKLFHCLHVGDYSKKVYAIAKKPRTNKKLHTIASDIEAALSRKDLETALNLLKNRPGDFARKLDFLFRTFKSGNKKIAKVFSKVVDKVSTRVLTQVYAHFKYRDEALRVIFPKGANVQSAVMLDGYTETLYKVTTERILKIINESLLKRFSSLDDLGTVYLDEQLKRCPLPAQLRSSSEGANIVARGTRLPMGDNEFTRMFIYWKGQDIDLSATFHDEDFKMVGQVSYTNGRSEKYRAYHSGDITYAPNGASEFIDIDTLAALETGARYVVMNVYVYSGPTFDQHEECFAGWMSRNNIESNEIYDPKTVVNKFDLTAHSKNAIPVVFDLETRESIWCDLGTTERLLHGGNNVHSNSVSTQDALKSITSLNKFTLHELFMLHVKARNGKLVTDSCDADTIFSLDKGCTPMDTDKINSDYLV